MERCTPRDNCEKPKRRRESENRRTDATAGLVYYFLNLRIPRPGFGKNFSEKNLRPLLLGHPMVNKDPDTKTPTNVVGYFMIFVVLSFQIMGYNIGL